MRGRVVASQLTGGRAQALTNSPWWLQPRYNSPAMVTGLSSPLWSTASIGVRNRRRWTAAAASARAWAHRTWSSLTALGSPRLIAARQRNVGLAAASLRSWRAPRGERRGAPTRKPTDDSKNGRDDDGLDAAADVSERVHNEDAVAIFDAVDTIGSNTQYEETATSGPDCLPATPFSARPRSRLLFLSPPYHGVKRARAPPPGWVAWQRLFERQRGAPGLVYGPRTSRECITTAAAAARGRKPIGDERAGARCSASSSRLPPHLPHLSPPQTRPRRRGSRLRGRPARP